MAKQRRVDSIDGGTSAVSGTSEKTSGHQAFGLLVEAENIDPGTDSLEVRVEVSRDDNRFTPVQRRQLDGYGLTLTTSDLVETDEAGVYAAYVSDHKIPAEYIRANVTNFDDQSDGELTVNAFVFIGGWSGDGKSYNNRTDTPVNY